MDLRQLEALVAVADTGSVTKAAKSLHLVQPSVTRQVGKLEAELGVALFDRTPRGMALTEPGGVLVERARRVLREIERIRLELAPESGDVAGVVSVGVLSSMVDVVAPVLVRTIADRHPAIRLRLLSAYSGQLQSWLDDGELDLSLVYDLDPSDSIAVMSLAREQLWAVAPRGSGLHPSHPTPCRVLFEQPLVLPVPGHGLRALIDRTQMSLSATPTVVAEVNAISLQKSLVVAGQCWTVLPASGVVEDVAAGLLEGAPLSHPEVEREVALGLPRGRRASRAAEIVTAQLVQVARDLLNARRWPGAQTPPTSRGLR